jgi:hypothetical protein
VEHPARARRPTPRATKSAIAGGRQRATRDAARSGVLCAVESSLQRVAVARSLRLGCERESRVRVRRLLLVELQSSARKLTPAFRRNPSVSVVNGPDARNRGQRAWRARRRSPDRGTRRRVSYACPAALTPIGARAPVVSDVILRVGPPSIALIAAPDVSVAARVASCPTEASPSEQCRRWGPSGSPAPIMFRGRQGKSVYLIYDEDTFLAGTGGEMAAALARARPLRWTRVLVVALAGVAGGQLLGSLSDHHRTRRLAPDRSQTASAHPRRAARDPRPTRGGPTTRPTARRPLGAHRHRRTYHRQARRERAGAIARHTPPAATASAREPSTAAKQPTPANPEPLPAGTYSKSPGAHASREFGFEG